MGPPCVPELVNYSSVSGDKTLVSESLTSVDDHKSTYIKYDKVCCNDEIF